MDNGTELVQKETGETSTSKIEVVDARGEKADVIQEKDFNARLESDKVEEKLIQFETFLGKYTKQKISEGLRVNLVSGPFGSGEVVNGILTVNLPNSSEIAEATNDPDKKQFLDVLTNAGTTYKEIAMISASSTTLHESEHMLIDSRPGSQLERDFKNQNPDIKIDKEGHTLSLLDEGITYAFQLEKDSENELIQKLEGEKPQKDESITIKMRKQLGEILRPKVKECVDNGIKLDENFLKFAGEKMKKLDVEEYVEEAENEQWKRVAERVASKLHDAWRESRRIEGTNEFEPRKKMTKDEVWILNHDGNNEIDIANTKFEDLPEDWKLENSNSAEVAVLEIRKAVKNGVTLDDEFIESASEVQHVQWLKRNENWAPLEQKMAYDQLSEAEKEKDRVVVRTALNVYGM